jgi:hypothetical protein
MAAYSTPAGPSRASIQVPGQGCTYCRQGHASGQYASPLEIITPRADSWLRSVPVEVACADRRRSRQARQLSLPREQQRMPKHPARHQHVNLRRSSNLLANLNLLGNFYSRTPSASLSPAGFRLRTVMLRCVPFPEHGWHSNGTVSAAKDEDLLCLVRR